MNSLNTIPLLLPVVVLAVLISVFRPRRDSVTHGSAHWATRRELKQADLILSAQEPHKLLPSPSSSNGQRQEASSLLVGYRGRLAIGLPERRQESHVLIVAPTGKRKSSGFFVPALLEERGHRSLFINDVKDELYPLTAGAMSQDHTILLFSPTRPTYSNRYNPLAHISTSKEARDFAAAWVSNTGLSQEEFYNTASRTLITALVLHLVDTEKQPPFSRLADVVSVTALEEIKLLLLSSPSKRARATAGAFLQTIEGNPKLSSGVMLGVANRFSILVDSQDYREVTSQNEIDFARMIDGERPTALFLSVPASATADLQPLTATLIMQMMNYLSKRAEQEPGGRLPRPFALYLDEFANAGRIPDIERHITLIRGAGMAVIAACQDFGQLDRIYGRDISDTLLSNFTSQVVLPGVGQREAEFYSRRLGFATVTSTSRSVSTSSDRGTATSATTTRSEAQRSLLLPEEIRQMPIGQFLLISDNAPPVRGRFRTYIERPELQDRLKLPIRRTRRVLRIVEEKKTDPAPEHL
jgi:type IV secretion system protein VirD4